ncbi:MAG: DEAD/DEAH box helicase [Candidatus Hydrogenedentes bacterium]|nr:DEAD/DEAH box helicase [Candidatus Hydrogenedentota bacterium]
MEIRLTPGGSLRWDRSEEGTESTPAPALQGVFESNWCEGLFTLAAEKSRADASPTSKYWRELAEHYLTGLCHIPAEAAAFTVETPSHADFASRVFAAPPMKGGEYLSPLLLQSIWTALDCWVHDAVTRAGGLESFLADRAPKWRQVGRVCFHLAENKSDAARPFAFMATYTAGFRAGGELKHLPLRKALEEYTGTKNRPALIKLLLPVLQATGRCGWVKSLVDSGEIYQPMAWSAERAYQFLRSVPDLEESGLAVRLPNWWQKRSRPQVQVTIGEQKKSTLGVGAMLDFDIRLALGDETLSKQDLKELLAGEDGLVQLKGQWVEVDREKLREAVEHWETLQHQAINGEISFVEGMRLLAGAPLDLKHEASADQERSWVHIAAGSQMREVLSALRDPGRLDEANPGGALRATLRPYQRDGLAWLRFLSELGLGACLADDMGLGKTIQVLALLLCQRGAGVKRRAPSLLIVPASLLGNWRSEATRFAPSLNLVFLHSAEMPPDELAKIAKAPARRLANADLVVTTYSMVDRQGWLEQFDWRMVILDEAQAIKNPATRQSKAVKRLQAQVRIALTGTPVENRMGDLWSLFDFINPGLLGSATVFKSFIKSLQGRERDQFAPLRQLVGPYILRRLKTDKAIIADLPEKTEIPGYCQLGKTQVKLYQKTIDNLKAALDSAQGIARRGLVLQSLMRLKQICNHPSQFSGDNDFNPQDSGKFLRLAEICEELAERQEKVLIFTQFREIIAPLAAHLAPVFQRDGLVLHGGTSVAKRKTIVDQFQQEDGPPFFILSLKAGGTGLNLTAASQVIHFDRWWNPAVENQATDRAFRIGQKKNVLVHKFITSGTVEEHIDALIEEKRQLAHEILPGGGELNLTELPDNELLNLVRLDVTRAAI